MKWKKTDLEKYEQAKEYIDTILLPIIPFQMGKDEESVKDAFQNEIMSIFGYEIEKELSGRVMLPPSYYYLKTIDKDKEIERINAWLEDIQEQPFKHIFLLTFDSGWKKNEQKLNGNLLWFPAIQTGDIQSSETQDIIRDQTTQISEMIRSFW